MMRFGFDIADYIFTETAIGGIVGTMAGFSAALAALSSSTFSVGAALALGTGFVLAGGGLGVTAGLMLFDRRHNPVLQEDDAHELRVRWRY